MLVRINKNLPINRRLKDFRFDNDGKFVTDNKRMILLLKKRFKYEEDTVLEETKVEVKENAKEEKKVYN